MDAPTQAETPVTGENDKSTIHEAAAKLNAMMDGNPPEEEAFSDETPPVDAPLESKEESNDESTDIEEPEQSDVVTRFDEIAEHLGVEEEFLDNLIVPTKINGVEGTTTIKNLVASYQKGESADQKFMELAETRKSFETEANQAKESLQQEWSRVQALNTELQNMLTGQEDESLQELRYSDPGEYAARMAERQAKIQKATQVQSQLQQENAAKLNDQYMQRLTVEKQKLLQALPSWADEKTMERENAELRTYLQSQGVDASEIDGKFDPQTGNLIAPGIIDHRFIVLARKAMQFDASKTTTEPKKKKLKSLPKVGSGKPRGKREVNQTKVQKQRQRVKESGSLEDAAMFIHQMRNS